MKNNPLNAYLRREHIIKTVRHFFDDQGFHEVMVPVLHTAIPTEPNIYPFTTTWNLPSESRQLYLSTSPESTLKKMLAAGLENCYAIAPAFRNLEGSGPQHQPEFLMLEWYRSGVDFRKIMSDIQELMLKIAQSSAISYQGKKIELADNWPSLSLVDLFAKYAGLKMEDIINEKNFKKRAAVKGYQTENTTWSALFDQIFLNEVQPHLPSEPFFVVDFPARISPLCQPQKAKPYLAERFEWYMCGMELANGNTENTEATILQKYFEAKELAGKKIAGVGLGIDRLTMVMTNATDIKDVTLSCL